MILMVFLIVWATRLISWGRRTTKIKCTKICLQQTFRAFNFCGLTRPTKAFLHENLTQKIWHKISRITVIIVCAKVSINLLNSSYANFVTKLNHSIVDILLDRPKLTLILLQNLVSSRDVPVKGTETRQEWKYAKRLPYYETMVEKKDKKTTCYQLGSLLAYSIIASFLYFLQVHPYLKLSFIETFLPSFCCFLEVSLRTQGGFFKNTR